METRKVVPQWTGYGMSRRRFIQSVTASGVVVAGGGLLTACGGGDDGDAKTITFIKGPAGEDDAQWQRQYAARFSKQHPGVEVATEFYDWETVDADLTAAFSRPEPPDVSYLVSRVWTRLAEFGALSDLSDRVKSDEYGTNYSAIAQEFWQGATWDGKIYGVPLAVAVSPWLVNLDLLEEAGVADSWNESYDAFYDAVRATTKGKVFGFGMGQSFTDSSYGVLQSFIHNGGGSLLNEDATAGALNTPEVVEGFDVLRRIHLEELAPRPGLYDTEGQSALFTAGRMAISAVWNNVLPADLSTNPPDFRWEVALPPAGPAGQFIGGDAGIISVAANSANEDTAWDYAEYFTSREIAADFLTKLGKIFTPARGDIEDLLFPKELEEETQLRKLTLEIGPQMKPFSPHPRQIEMLRAMSDEFELLVRGKTESSEAVVAIDAKVSELAAKA